MSQAGLVRLEERIHGVREEVSRSYLMSGNRQAHPPVVTGHHLAVRTWTSFGVTSVPRTERWEGTRVPDKNTCCGLSCAQGSPLLPTPHPAMSGPQVTRDVHVLTVHSFLYLMSSLAAQNLPAGRASVWTGCPPKCEQVPSREP